VRRRACVCCARCPAARLCWRLLCASVVTCGACCVPRARRVRAPPLPPLAAGRFQKLALALAIAALVLAVVVDAKKEDKVRAPPSLAEPSRQTCHPVAAPAAAVPGWDAAFACCPTLRTHAARNCAAPSNCSAPAPGGKVQGDDHRAQGGAAPCQTPCFACLARQGRDQARQGPGAPRTPIAANCRTDQLQLCAAPRVCYLRCASADLGCAFPWRCARALCSCARV